ncbi:MAG TPA: DNA-directed RNA polymerase subunit omega [Blastocatellia bacterium]|nr:DNA-directed RNA polymerase subunit omega [Blastocatellia bacterium]
MKKDSNNTVANTIDSKYRKILIAAKRSKQLQKGARPRIEMPGAKATRVALAEVDRGLVGFEIVKPGEK